MRMSTRVTILKTQTEMEMMTEILNMMRVMQQNRKDQNTTEADSNAAGGDSQSIYPIKVLVHQKLMHWILQHHH